MLPQEWTFESTNSPACFHLPSSCLNRKIPKLLLIVIFKSGEVHAFVLCILKNVSHTFQRTLNLSVTNGVVLLKGCAVIPCRPNVSLFQVLYLELDFNVSLLYGSQFLPAWNLDSLLGLCQVPVFSEVPLHVLDYRWSQNPNWYRIHFVPHRSGVLLLTLNIFIPFFVVSIVDFEQA